MVTGLVLDEGQHFGFQAFFRGKAPAVEQLAHQDTQPDPT